MSGPKVEIPFLPGNSFQDVQKLDFRKPHSLGYVNGYPVQPKPLLGIGLNPIKPNESLSTEELLAAIGSDPNLLYGDKRFFSTEKEPRFVPAHVAFDKVVLRFDAYFKETVHESVEQYHLRKVRILYFLEDDSIAVVEPPVENSGIPHGVLIKRQRLAKSSTEYYTVKDFNVGINITFYGKTFRIVSCDKFTESYLSETEGIHVNPSEPVPRDPYQNSRARPVRVNHLGPKRHEKLKRFLENDRKVLRYYCVWDDRDSMFGELREFIIHYHLVDDSIEVREVQKPNNGRDPFPILLRRQQLPKSFKELSDLQESEKYTWKDFEIGSVVNVLGRPFLIRDCDEYTKRFYSENTGVPVESFKAITIEDQAVAVQEQEVPPYNGFGTEEDSLGSCKYLVLKPPKKDFIKMLENEHKVLRFVARMESAHREDKERRFVLSYRLADDMMTIYEPPQRNAGILGGKFMERTRVARRGASTNASNSSADPQFYDARDLFVGARICVHSHRFVLIDADEYVFTHMEADPAAFPHADRRRTTAQLRSLAAALPQQQRDALRARITNADPAARGTIDRRIFVEIAKAAFGDAIKDHELITVARQLEKTPRAVGVQEILAFL